MCTNIDTQVFLPTRIRMDKKGKIFKPLLLFTEDNNSREYTWIHLDLKIICERWLKMPFERSKVNFLGRSKLQNPSGKGLLNHPKFDKKCWKCRDIGITPFIKHQWSPILGGSANTRDLFFQQREIILAVHNTGRDLMQYRYTQCTSWNRHLFVS